MEATQINWLEILTEQGVSVVLLILFLFGMFKWAIPNITKYMKDTTDAFISENKSARDDFRDEMRIQRESHLEELRIGRESARENFEKIHSRIDEAFRVQADQPIASRKGG